MVKRSFVWRYEAPLAIVLPLEESPRKLQTSMAQIEFHNDTLSSYRNVEQVRLKTIQKTLVQVGPAVWLQAGMTLWPEDRYL